MIHLDGSHGEGGGQILRTSLALSMLTRQPIRIDNIRARRPKPGLMRQHLVCVQAATEISGARTEGAELHSTSLTFEPQAVRAGRYRFAVSSAGSCTLVLQTVLPPLLHAAEASTIELAGGTHNPMAPPYHFLERAYAPLVRRLGGDLRLNLKRHGFYPAGGGEVEAIIRPVPVGDWQHLALESRGALVEAYAEALVAGVPRTVAQRELDTLGAAMGWSGDQLRTAPLRQNEGPGNALMATLAYQHVTEVFTEFGDRQVSAEQVAHRLAKEVRAYQASEAAVGPHLCDQLALLIALAGKGSFTASEITEHARTNFLVIQKFLPVRFDIEPSPAGCRVAVTGL